MLGLILLVVTGNTKPPTGFNFIFFLMCFIASFTWNEQKVKEKTVKKKKKKCKYTVTEFKQFNPQPHNYASLLYLTSFFLI